MTRLFIIIATALLLSSCNAELTAHPWELLDFSSEEEFISHVRDFQSVFSEDESHDDSHKVANVTHYYKFKNPPTGANLNRISLGTTGVNIAVEYRNSQHLNDLGEPEGVMIQYAPHYLFDAEKRDAWTPQTFHEAREIDGTTYFIRKGDGIAGLLWAVEWINAEGYRMYSAFPYRFTADEVLAYVSDLERVEIG